MAEPHARRRHAEIRESCATHVIRLPASKGSPRRAEGRTRGPRADDGRRRAHREGPQRDPRVTPADGGSGALAGAAQRLQDRRRPRPARAGSGVAQYGQACQIASSGAPHDVHACLRRVVQTGHTTKVESTRPRQVGQRRSSSARRSSIARSPSSRSRRSASVSGGRKSTVDQRADERGEETQGSPPSRRATGRRPAAGV